MPSSAQGTEPKHFSPSPSFFPAHFRSQLGIWSLWSQILNFFIVNLTIYSHRRSLHPFLSSRHCVNCEEKKGVSRTGALADTHDWLPGQSRGPGICDKGWHSLLGDTVPHLSALAHERNTNYWLVPPSPSLEILGAWAIQWCPFLIPPTCRLPSDSLWVCCCLFCLSFLFSFFKVFEFVLYLYLHWGMPQHTCGGRQTTLWEMILSFQQRVLGIKLR